MTSVRRLAYLVTLLALVSSGAYVFVYLYRWEWNRALIAGVIFIAAEIGLVGASVMQRIKSLEQKLDARDASAGRPPAEEAEAFAPRSPFAWLSDTKDGMGVFIPVLMGVGVLISALAWTVERVATATARPVVQRRLAARMAPLSLDETMAVHKPRPVMIVGQTIAAVAVIVLAVSGLDRLADATQNRVDRVAPGTRSEVVIQMHVRDPNGSAHIAAQSLWGACQTTVSRTLVGGTAKTLSGTRFSLELTPALGRHDARRLHGCLEDATLDGVQAKVVSISGTRVAD